MSGTILGVDPGVSESGWAVISAEGGETRLVSSGLVRTPPSQPLSERLKTIHAAFEGLLAEHNPSAVAIEEMFFLTAAHTIRSTLQARGVILLAAAQARRPISEYNPRTVKLTLTGSGRAAKSQMQRAIQRCLGLAQVLRPNDVADAAAIALCHLRSRRYSRLRVLDSFGGAR